MKYTFVVEAGNLDSNGNQVVIAGVRSLPATVPLSKDFKDKIGTAFVFEDGGVLKAESEIPDGFLDAYPAIGFGVINEENNSIGRTFTGIKLHELSLCSSRNADESIKTIREQIKKPPTN